MHKARSNANQNRLRREAVAERQKPLPLAEQDRRADENRLRRAIINTSLGYGSPPCYDGNPPRKRNRPAEVLNELASTLSLPDFLTILASINRFKRKAA